MTRNGASQGSGLSLSLVPTFAHPTTTKQVTMEDGVTHHLSILISPNLFLQIAEYKSGIVPVQYRRIPCQKEGGIRFTVTGNPYFTLVLVWNVGGAGDVKTVLVKGNKVGWTPMKRNWGQNWETDVVLVGQSLTFRVVASDGRTSTSWHIAPRDWQFGQTYIGKNFK